MAKHALTLTLSLFLLFALSHSSSPSDLPQNPDLNGQDLSYSSVPDSETKPAAILLPSEKPESDARTLARLDPDSEPEVNARTEPDPHQRFVTVPLTKLDFHERNIPLSLRFPYRHGLGHRCRHGFGHRHGMRPRFHQIPYGNDMILSNEKVNREGESREEDPLPEGFAGRVRIHRMHRRPRFESMDEMAAWKGEEDVMRMPKRFEHDDDEDEDEWDREKHHHHHRWGHRHHKHHHDHDHDHDHHDDDDHEHRDEDEGGIMTKIRKFLTHF